MQPVKAREGQGETRSSRRFRILTGAITFAVGIGSPAPVESVALGISTLLTSLPSALADHDAPVDPPPMDQRTFERAYEWARAYEGDYRRMSGDDARAFALRFGLRVDGATRFRSFSRSYAWARAYEGDYQRMNQAAAVAFGIRAAGVEGEAAVPAGSVVPQAPPRVVILRRGL